MPSTVVYVFYVSDVYERETSTRSIDRSMTIRLSLRKNQQRARVCLVWIEFRIRNAVSASNLYRFRLQLKHLDDGSGWLDLWFLRLTC